MSKLLDNKQVAEMLGCSVRHLIKLRKAGLPYVQIGLNRGAIRFKLEDVEAWISSQTRSATANNSKDEAEGNDDDRN